VSCATTVAYFGFGNWLPSLLEARGVGVAKSLMYTAIIAFSYPVTPFLVSFIADRSERKWQIVAGAALVATAGLAFAAQSSVVGWLTCGLLITVGNNVTSFATHTYRSELFRTGVRARGIGLVYSIDRIVAAFNSYLIGFILVAGGPTAVLVSIATACLVAMVVVGSFGPRTRGVGADEVPTESAHQLGRAPL
jgi:putative MFS transporter